MRILSSIVLHLAWRTVLAVGERVESILQVTLSLTFSITEPCIAYRLFTEDHADHVRADPDRS